MNSAVIDRLADLLDRDEPLLLSTDERSLVRAALAALADSERRARHYERLFESAGFALGAADRAAASAIDLVLSRPEAPRFDAAKADDARAALEAKLRSAGSARDVVAAVLGFARDVAVLAG